jgi:hypothetical protein
MYGRLESLVEVECPPSSRSDSIGVPTPHDETSAFESACAIVKRCSIHPTRDRDPVRGVQQEREQCRLGHAPS